MRRLEAISVNNFKVYIDDWSYRAFDMLLQVLLDANTCMSCVLFKHMINKSGDSLRMGLNLYLLFFFLPLFTFESPLVITH